jgi:hypothetical protein
MLTGTNVDNLGGPIHGSALDLHLGWIPVENVEETRELYHAGAELLEENNVLTTVPIKPNVVSHGHKRRKLENLVEGTMIVNEPSLVGTSRPIAYVNIRGRKRRTAALVCLVAHEELLVTSEDGEVVTVFQKCRCVDSLIDLAFNLK